MVGVSSLTSYECVALGAHAVRGVKQDTFAGGAELPFHLLAFYAEYYLVRAKTLPLW